jgi:hypothetical protein
MSKTIFFNHYFTKLTYFHNPFALIAVTEQVGLWARFLTYTSRHPLWISWVPVRLNLSVASFSHSRRISSTIYVTNLSVGIKDGYGFRDCTDADMYIPQILSNAPARTSAALPTITRSYVPEGFGRVIRGQCSTTYCSRQETAKASVQRLKIEPPRLGEHNPTEKHASQRHRGGSPIIDLPRSGPITLPGGILHHWQAKRPKLITQNIPKGRRDRGRPTKKLTDGIWGRNRPTLAYILDSYMMMMMTFRSSS